MLKNTPEIVSISSLESPEHARQKDPKILTMTWMIGKRCNYDCSYCPSWLHDSFSPHMHIDDIKNVVDSITDWTLSNDKQLKIIFTGGEPFIHPKFLDVIEYIKEKNNIHSIGVHTNGSASLNTYLKFSNYLSNISVSLHLEESNSIIEETIKKIDYINKNTNMFINVNLMAVPEKIGEVSIICNILKEKNIKFSIESIDVVEHNDKSNRKIPRKIYKKNKKYFDNISTEQRITDKESITNERLDRYYTKDQLEFLKEHQNSTMWQDTKVYYESHTEETNSATLLTNRLTNFLGWYCYIGIDSIYIDHDGLIYRGNCQAGKHIGHVSDSKIQWPKEPITCPYNICSCQTDIRIRKIKNLHYIDNIVDN